MDSVEAELENVEAELARLLQHRYEVIKDLRELKRRRGELAKEMAELSERIGKLRRELTGHSCSLKSIRESRNEVVEKLRSVKDRLKEAADGLRKIDPAIKRMSIDELRDRIREAEWRLQTEPLSRAEEKKLVSYISTMESRLKTLERIAGLREEMGSLSSEAEVFRSKLDELSKMADEVRGSYTNVKSELSARLSRTSETSSDRSL